MSKVVSLPGARSVDVVLEQVRERDLDSIVVIGWKDGDFWFHTSHELCKDVLWDLEMTKQVLME